MAPVDNIETYCENGIWKTRWQHSTKPFATGSGKESQISQGATVAQWYGVDHIIKAPDGTIERNSYRTPTGHAIDHLDGPISPSTRRRTLRSATTSGTSNDL